MRGPRLLLGPCRQRVHAAAVALAAPIGHGGGSEGILKLDRLNRPRLVTAALTQVLWCRRTWLETTGNTFCQVGRVRVNKDDESFSSSLRNHSYLMEPDISNHSTDLFNFLAPHHETSQEALLLPLLVSEKTHRVMLYYNKGLGRQGLASSSEQARQSAAGAMDCLGHALVCVETPLASSELACSGI